VFGMGTGVTPPI